MPLKIMITLILKPFHHHHLLMDLLGVLLSTTSDLTLLIMVSFFTSSVVESNILASLSASDAKKNLELAFRLAEKELGCTQYLEVDDLLNR